MTLFEAEISANTGGTPMLPWLVRLTRLACMSEFLKLLQELHDRGRGGHLADPEEEHPLDNLGFRFGDLHTELSAVFLGHESFCEVRLVFPKGHFNALRDGTGLVSDSILAASRIERILTVLMR